MDQDDKYSIVSTNSFAYSNIKSSKKVFTVLSHQAFSNLSQVLKSFAARSFLKRSFLNGEKGHNLCRINFKTSLQVQPRHIGLFNHFDYLLIFWNISHVERLWFRYFISVLLCLIGISIKFPKSNEFKNESYDHFSKKWPDGHFWPFFDLPATQLGWIYWWKNFSFQIKNHIFQNRYYDPRGIVINGSFV